MRIDYLNSMTGAGTEAQTVMVNDIPEVNKVTFVRKFQANIVALGLRGALDVGVCRRSELG